MQGWLVGWFFLYQHYLLFNKEFYFYLLTNQPTGEGLHRSVSTSRNKISLSLSHAISLSLYLSLLRALSLVQQRRRYSGGDTQ